MKYYLLQQITLYLILQQITLYDKLKRKHFAATNLDRLSVDNFLKKMVFLEEALFMFLAT